VQLIAPAILERFTRKLNLADTAVLERTRFPDDQAAAALEAVMNPQRTMWAAAKAVDMTEAMRETLAYVEEHQTSAMQKNPDAMPIAAGLLDRRPELADFFHAPPTTCVGGARMHPTPSPLEPARTSMLVWTPRITNFAPLLRVAAAPCALERK
jgi:hypothetical protein